MDFLNLIEKERIEEQQQKKEQEKQIKEKQRLEKKQKRQEKRKEAKEKISNFFSAIAESFDDGVLYLLTVPVLWPVYAIKSAIKGRSGDSAVDVKVGLMLDLIVGVVGFLGFLLGGAAYDGVKHGKVYEIQTQVAQNLKQDSSFSIIDNPCALEIKSKDGKSYTVDIYAYAAESNFSNKEFYSFSYEADSATVEKFKDFTIKPQFNDDKKFDGLVNPEIDVDQNVFGVVDKNANERIDAWKDMEVITREQDCLEVTKLQTEQVNSLNAELQIAQDKVVATVVEEYNKITLKKEDSEITL